MSDHNHSRPEIAAACVEVLYRYAAAVDARDESGIVALLHQDVVLSRGGGPIRGVAAFIEAYRPFLDGDQIGSRHAVFNSVLEADDGALVTIRSAFQATSFFADATRVIHGEYLDDLVLVDGLWLIRHKRNILQWRQDLPPATPFGT